MTKLAASLLLCGLLWIGTSKAQTTPVVPDSTADSASLKPATAKPAAAKPINTNSITFVPNPGRITSLDSLLKPHRGRVVYVDFWGTWCLPCRKEMPYSARLKEKLKGEPVDFLYIAYENGYTAKMIEKWKATVQQLHITGRHFMMNPAFEGGLTEFISVDSYPRYIIIDRTGEIINDDAARPSETTEVLRQIREAIAQ